MGRPSRTHTNAGPGLTAVARFDDKGTRRVGPSATSEMRTTCPSAHARFSVHVQGFEGKLGSERSERWQGSGARERECARSTQQTKERVQQMRTGLEGKISEGEDSCKEKNCLSPQLLSRTGVGGIPPGWGANGLSASSPRARAQGTEQDRLWGTRAREILRFADHGQAEQQNEDRGTLQQLQPDLHRGLNSPPRVE